MSVMPAMSPDTEPTVSAPDAPTVSVPDTEADEVLDHELPSRIQGVTPELTERAMLALGDGKVRRFRPLPEETATAYTDRAEVELGVIRRIVASTNPRKTITTRTSGGYILWQVVPKRDRGPMAPEHLAKLRAAAAARKAAKAAEKAKGQPTKK